MRNIRVNILAVCLVALAILAYFDYGFAAMVRGRIQRGPYPVPYVTVTLFSSSRGRSAPSVTGPDGMYYLYNVPPGQYIIEIWLGGRPIQYSVNVGEPHTDYPPISIP
jgi:hypothetical protein